MQVRMQKIVYIVLVGLFVCATLSAQQRTDEPLNAVWLQNDLDGVKFLVQLTPIENHTIPELKKRFQAVKGNSPSFSEGNLGFGARRVRLAMGFGYMTAFVDVHLFNNRIVHYSMGADIDQKTWKTKHGHDIKRVWRENGGPPFIEKNREIIFEKDYPAVWKLYSNVLEKRLGRKKDIPIPYDLKTSYELLTNAFENSSISTVACSNGRPAIMALEKAGRKDLIENVLRGFNPGGRIYAAISLLRMKRKGIKISASTQRTIGRIIASDANASTCYGDLGIGGLKARNIVWEFVHSNEW